MAFRLGNLAVQDLAAQIEIRLAQRTGETTDQHGTQTLIRDLEFRRRTVRGEDNLLVLGNQGRDRVEQLVFRLRLAGDEVDIIDQQDIDTAHHLLEGERVAGPHGRHETGQEFLGRQVKGLARTGMVFEGRCHGVHEVRLADPVIAIEEDRIEGRRLGTHDRACGGGGDFIGRTDAETVKGETRFAKIVRIGLPVRLGRRLGGRQGLLRRFTDFTDRRGRLGRTGCARRNQGLRLGITLGEQVNGAMGGVEFRPDTANSGTPMVFNPVAIERARSHDDNGTRFGNTDSKTCDFLGVDCRAALVSQMGANLPPSCGNPPCTLDLCTRVLGFCHSQFVIRHRSPHFCCSHALRASHVFVISAKFPLAQRRRIGRQTRNVIRMGMIALRGPKVTLSPFSVNRIQRLESEILRLTREIRDRIDVCLL